MQHSHLKLVINFDKFAVHRAKHLMLNLLHQNWQLVALIHVSEQERSVLFPVNTLYFFHQDLKFFVSDVGILGCDLYLKIALADYLFVLKQLDLTGSRFTGGYDFAVHLQPDFGDLFF